MSHYKIIKKCRICGNTDLKDVVAIDPQFLSPTFVKTNEGNELSKIKVPQTLTLCSKENNKDACGLVQLKETVDPKLLYTNYFYRSGISDTMRKDLADVVDECIIFTELYNKDYIMDIGANDCTMIGNYLKLPEKFNLIAVEPAKNIDWSGVDKSIKIVNNYFSKQNVTELLGRKKVKLITCCAMFYDLDDPNSFVADIKSILHKQGIWCIQLSYLPAMIRNLNFYDICNEHLEYYCLQTLEELFGRHGLTIFHAQENDVNGGSVRVFVTHQHRIKQRSETLLGLYEIEEKMDLFNSAIYSEFHNKMMELKEKIKKVIHDEIDKGNPVIGLGASTKGNMLMQFFDLDNKIVPYISERNPDKVGLRTMGTDIELISEKRARELNPSCMLVLPWYFKKEIVKREKEYLDTGGKLLFPMPYPHIVHKDGEIKL